MNNDYIQYPGTSMVWVYQSERTFTENEKQHIQNRISEFVNNWDSHGSLVKGTFNIFHDAFIVIFADDQGYPLCGRAQTASVTLIKELEQELGIKLLDRMNQSFMDENGVKLVKLSELKSLYKAGQINDETLVFDNTVINKNDFDNRWKVALKDAWHKRFV